MAQGGEIQEFHLDNCDGAKKSYLDVLELDPRNLIAIRGLERIYQVNKEYNALQNMLLKELQVQETWERELAIYQEIALLKEEKFGEVEGAIEYFLKIHQQRSDDLFIIERLKKLWHQQQDRHHYAEIVEKEIGLRGSGEQVWQLRQELLQIYDEHLGQPQTAIVHGEAILADHPDHLPTILRLQKLYETLARESELAQMYLKESELLATTGSPERMLFLNLQAGKIYQRLQQNQAALACFQQVIAIEPSHGEALSRIVEMLSKEQQWQELIEIYKLTACLSLNKGEVENLHLKMAQLWESKIAEPQQALFHYRIAYQMNPSNLAAIKGMRKILEKQDQWIETISMLEKEAPLLEEQKRPKVYVIIGDIWSRKLNQPAQALHSYLRVLEYGFHRATAQKAMELQEYLQDYQGLAVLLEKEIRLTELKSEKIPQKLHKLGTIYWEKLASAQDAIRVFNALLKLDANNVYALDMLEQIYAATEDWQELIVICRLKLADNDDEQEVRRLHRKIAAVFEQKLHLGNYAIHHYEKALQLDANCIDTIHVLQSLYQEWGQFKKLVALYQKEIELISDADRVIYLHHEIGDIWEQKLFDGHQAIEVFEQLLAEFPQNMETAVKLANIYRRHENWQQLIRVLQMLATDAQQRDSIDEEIALQLDLGNVYKKTGERQQAIAAFQRVLELEEFHEDAFAGLESLYEGGGMFVDLIETLEDKAQLVTEPSKMIDIQLRLGKLYEEKRQDYDQAITCFQRVLAIEDNPTALRALHRLYQTRQNWSALEEIARRELQLTPGAEAEAELCFLLGTLNLEYFENSDAARDYFLQCIEHQPSHAGALMQLCEIAEKKRDWQEAARYMQQASEHVKKPEEKAPLLTSLGSLYLNNLQSSEKAVAYYQEALAVNPESMEALEALTNIYFQQGQWPKLEPLLAQLIPLLPDKPGDKLATCQYRWACTAEALGQFDDAISRYLCTLQLDDGHLAALLALGRIFLSRQNWRQALQAYKKAYSLEALEQKSEVLVKIAMAEEKLEQYPAAIEHYEAYLQLVANDREVLKSLARLHQKMENHHQSIVYWQKIIDSDQVSEDERYTALKARGELLRKLEEFEDAIEAYSQLFEYNPQDLSVALALTDLHIQLEQWEQAEHWNQQYYVLLENSDQRVANRCRHGHILFNGLKQHQAAIAAYREALELDPACIDAIQGTATVYRSQKNWRAMADSYRDFLENLPAEKRKLGFTVHLALGQLLVEKLDDPQGAVHQFEKALQLDPDHLETQIAVTEIKSASPEHKREAIKGHLLLLRRDPFRIASYRSLARLFQETGQSDRELRALRALQVLAPEERIAGGSEDKPKPTAQLTATIVAQHLIPPRIAPLHQVMALTGEYQEKNYPPDLEKKYGVRKKEHLGAESVQRPVWYHANTVMRVLGINDMQMYINPRPSAQIFLENTTPPSIIISQTLIDSVTEAELKFLLARYLFYISQKQVLAFKLSSGELEQYFCLLRGAFVVAEEPLGPEAEALQKRIKSSLPRRVRKGLENQDELWQEVAKVTIGQYLKALEYAANRLAFVISDSLQLAVAMLYRHQRMCQGDFRSQSRPDLEAMMQLDGVADLLLFDMAEQYSKIRQLCSLAVD